MGTTNILDLNNRFNALEKAVDELAESYPADNVMMSDGVTSVEDALDGAIESIPNIVTIAGIQSLTGVQNNWVYLDVTFTTPFKTTPVVTVNNYDTGTGNTWYPPMLKDITSTGFKAGWYNATGTKEVIWQAIGVR